jgi:phosphoribulokinase
MYGVAFSKPGAMIDASIGILPAPSFHVHCNTSGTYRIWTSIGNYADLYLYKGLAYGLPGTIKITTTADAAVGVGEIIAFL